MNRARPVVMSFSGNDPTGGAGIQADIEAIRGHQKVPFARICRIYILHGETNFTIVYKIVQDAFGYGGIGFFHSYLGSTGIALNVELRCRGRGAYTNITAVCHDQ